MNTSSCPTETCDSLLTISDVSLTHNRFYYGFFVVGQILNGFGGVGVWTLGTVYIDENLCQQGVSLALACVQAIALVGSAVAYVGGGFFLNFWVDGDVQQPEGISNAHDLWVGNWWCGFVFGGVASIFIGSLIGTVLRIS